MTIKHKILLITGVLLIIVTVVFFVLTSSNTSQTDSSMKDRESIDSSVVNQEPGLSTDQQIETIEQGEVILDSSQVKTPEQFKSECQLNGGSYKERVRCGVACIKYAECGYGSASDGGRLCASADLADNLSESTCVECSLGKSCGPAAGDFGPEKCYCKSYKRLERMSLPQDTLLPRITNDFYFIYSFGVGERNLLDSKNNLYVKDMICDPQKEYMMKLNENEKKIIYESILENDLINIKDDFTRNCDDKGVCKQIIPLSIATLKLTVNGKTKTIQWRGDYFDTNDPDLVKFENVSTVIQNIITQKEAELQIEQPECLYQ